MAALYFAYGMNMDPQAMARRCPAAALVAPARLDGHRFALNGRGVSTVLPAPGSCVHGILWTLTTACGAALDRIEGIDAGHYVRAQRPVAVVEEQHMAMLYIATDSRPGAPRQPYFDTVRAAARRHGFPAGYLAGLDMLCDTACPLSD